MTVYVEAPHVVALIEEHGLTVAPVAWSEAFALRLSRLAPMGNGVDWTGVDHRVVAYEAFAEAVWPDVERLFVCYAADQPGLVADAAFVAEHLDELYWKAAGHRYLCALRGDEPDFRKVITWNGADRLVFAQWPNR
ncbi:hypothetical protein JNUCC0626_42650 [Lentzea sp. JNUCC 0626]|uniref:hypothetical protein n=1 Tax=Lentzea sp. JNUCC 0626 TaxID=3367513 RepID=UPI00374A9879